MLVMYQNAGWSGVWQMVRLLWGLRRESVLYLNGFLARRFSMLAVWMCWLGLCRPRAIVLAPRGEFSPGALGINSFRKRLYLGVVRFLGLYESVLWHASSNREAQDILDEFCNADVVVAGNLPGKFSPHKFQKKAKVPVFLRLCCVSRVARMKNLRSSFQLIAGLEGNVVFSIYGPMEDRAYWAECEEAITALPKNVRVEYRGEIGHEEVGRVFGESDLFLLPTLGENYGHVICESLAAGCPVLVSDRTPWRGLEELGVGWDLPLEEPERWKVVLQRCVDMGEEEHRAMRERARAYAKEKMEDPAAVEANRRLFRIAFGLEEMPKASAAEVAEETR
ncbi:MAG: glycosyltransferase [Bryobacteraceae bacterium]|nr:glycosyltransferase [Bryobacteraceae bacterium]